MIESGVVLLIVTLWVVAYVPAAGLKIGEAVAG